MAPKCSKRQVWFTNYDDSAVRFSVWMIYTQGTKSVGMDVAVWEV